MATSPDNTKNNGDASAPPPYDGDNGTPTPSGNIVSATPPYDFNQYEFGQKHATEVKFSTDQQNIADWATTTDGLSQSTLNLASIPVVDPANVGELGNTIKTFESYCSEIAHNPNQYVDASDADIQPTIQPVVNETCDCIRDTIDSAPKSFPSDVESLTLAESPAKIPTCVDDRVNKLDQIQFDTDTNTGKQLTEIKTAVVSTLTEIKTQSVACGFHDISPIIKAIVDRIVQALENIPVHDTTVVGNLETLLQDLKTSRDDYVTQWKKCEEDAEDADFDEKDNFLKAVNNLCDETVLVYREELTRIRNNIQADTSNMQSMRESIPGSNGTTYKYIDNAIQEQAQSKRQAMAQAEADLHKDIDAINAAVAAQKLAHDNRTARLVQFRANTMQLVLYLSQERKNLLNWDRSEVSATTRAVQQSRLQQLRPEWRDQVVQIAQSTGHGIVPALEADLQYRKLEVEAKNQLQAYVLCHAQCTQQLDTSCDKAAKHVASLTTLLETVKTNKTSLNKLLNTLRRALTDTCTALVDRINPLRDQERNICTAYKEVLDLGIEHIEDTSIKQSLHRRLAAEQEVSVVKQKRKSVHISGKTSEKAAIKQELAEAEAEQKEAVDQEDAAEARLASWVGAHTYADLCEFLQSEDIRKTARRKTMSSFQVEAHEDEDVKKSIFSSVFQVITFGSRS